MADSRIPHVPRVPDRESRGRGRRESETSLRWIFVSLLIAALALLGFSILWHQSGLMGPALIASLLGIIMLLTTVGMGLAYLLTSAMVRRELDRAWRRVEEQQEARVRALLEEERSREQERDS